MGAALAAAAIAAGHRVTIVSGPVHVEYPVEAEVISVVSTEEMLAACQKVFPDCDGLIAVAAPCDFRPADVAPQKIHKTGEPLRLELVETPDIVATLAAERTGQWIVAFALETEDRHARARQKLERKNCDLIWSTVPRRSMPTRRRRKSSAKMTKWLGSFAGSKGDVARGVFEIIQRRLIAIETSKRLSHLQGE